MASDMDWSSIHGMIPLGSSLRVFSILEAHPFSSSSSCHTLRRFDASSAEQDAGRGRLVFLSVWLSVLLVMIFFLVALAGGSILFNFTLITASTDSVIQALANGLISDSTGTAVAADAPVKLQLLVPGELAVPGSPSGK